MKRVELEEKIFVALMLLATVLVIGSLAAVFAVVLLRGASALDVAMLTQTPSGGYYFGKGGGILNAIIGSLYLAGGATALAFVLSLPVTMFLRILQQIQVRKLCAAFIRRSLGYPFHSFRRFHFHYHAISKFEGLAVLGNHNWDAVHSPDNDSRDGRGYSHDSSEGERSFLCSRRNTIRNGIQGCNKASFAWHADGDTAVIRESDWRRCISTIHSRIH